MKTYLKSLRRYQRKSNNSNAGQIYSQALIYIMTIILVSVILIYGYKAINNFRHRAEQVSILKFKNDLTNTIEGLTSEYKSQKTKEFLLPAGMKSICFVDTYKSSIILPSDLDPILKDSVEPYVSQADRIKIRNIFLLDNTVKESFNIPVKIKTDADPDNEPVEPDVLCKTAVSGKVSLVIRGEGDGVTIS